jgi:hypothetical protein
MFQKGARESAVASDDEAGKPIAAICALFRFVLGAV